MQALWTRAATPASRSCRCYACINAYGGVVSGRTTASRRRLLIGNGVTMFYSSIFAVGAFLDASAKKKRRIELDKDIEAVKAEVQELRDEEARLLSQLSMRWKPRKGRVKPQSRSFSTAAADAAGARSIPENPREATQEAASASQTRDVDPSREDAIPIFDEVDSRDASEEGNEDKPDFEQFERWPKYGPGVVEQLDHQDDRKRALQYLAMKELALKLLLRPSIAPGYVGIRVNYSVKLDLQNMDIERMLDELKRVQKKMNYLRKDPDANFEDVLPLMTPEEHARLREEREGLQEELKDLVFIYKSGKMPLAVLIVRVADNLVASKEPIPPRAIPFLIDVFTKAKQRDIVLMIMDSLLPNGFLMTNHAISEAVNFFGNTYDLLGFRIFLQRLQDPSCPIVRKPWVCTRVGDVDIPVPQGSPHPYLVTLLIKTALNLDQPHKADAWFDYLQKQGYTDNAKTLTAYIRYYAYYQNWRKGVYFLYRAIKHLRSTKVFGRRDALKRLILSMASFCNACGEVESARVILKAAVTSGIESAQKSHNDRFEPLVRSLGRWEEFEATAAGMKLDITPDGTAEYRLFSQKTEKHFWQKLNEKREQELKDKEMSAFFMNSEVYEEYEGTIFDLRNEVADLKIQLKAATSAQQDEQMLHPSRGDHDESTDPPTNDPIDGREAEETRALDGALPRSGDRDSAIQKVVISHHMTNPISDFKANNGRINGRRLRRRALDKSRQSAEPSQQS